MFLEKLESELSDGEELRERLAEVIPAREFVILPLEFVLVHGALLILGVAQELGERSFERYWLKEESGRVTHSLSSGSCVNSRRLQRRQRLDPRL